MYIDSMTLAAVADELRLLLLNARIDTIIQPTEHSLAFQCYAPGREGQGGRNRWLYLSAHPQLARVHLTAIKPAKIVVEPPPFVMLLRKYLEGMWIESIEPPRWERTLEIVASHRAGPESEERVRYRLIAEIMGRTSNLIFCDEHYLILGSLKRVGAEINRYRTVATNVQYVPPPPQTRLLGGQHLPRLEPTTVTASQLSLIPGNEVDLTSEELKPGQRPATASAKLWQLLVKHLTGFSPLLAREAVFRTTGATETAISNPIDVWEELAWNVRDLGKLYDTQRWQPQLVEKRDPNDPARKLPVAFAAYPLEQYAEQVGLSIRESPSLNVLIDDFYARSEWQDALESLRAPLRRALQSHHERCKRRAELLQQEQNALGDGELYRFQAELLLASQQSVPPGSSSVILPNIFVEGQEDPVPLVTIPLDPRFDAVGNANRLFNRYHKLRRAAALIPGQVEQNLVELATLEQLQADLLLAENPNEVVLVKAEVQTAGYLRGKVAQPKVNKKQKPGKQGKAKGKATGPGGGVPLQTRSSEGFTILVGRNSRQNEEVTFHQATPNDLWLHARGVAGAHVIVKAGGREIPKATIEQAATLAAFYSQARGNTTAPVDYTLQRHVRHMKGAGPGMVNYERERTLYARPLSLAGEEA